MDEKNADFPFSEEDWNTCLSILKHLRNNPTDNPDNKTFGALITKIHKNAKKQMKKESSLPIKEADLALLKESTIVKVALNNKTTYSVSSPMHSQTYEKLNRSKNCYSCHLAYEYVHSFYHRLCPACAEFNYNQRFTKVDLKNRKVILTGGRVKVGFATALKLLRSNAQLTITTRFPGLAFKEFQKEKDFEKWKERNLGMYRI